MSSKRLIETTFPLREISVEAAREKSIRHGHICTMHLWWARKPLVAARAAILEAFINQSPDAAAQQRVMDAIIKVCTWEESTVPSSIRLARDLVLKNNDGKAPKVLDPFAGGGSIPLEALRVGCDVYASELNPVAVLLNLCTVVYPQRYGKTSHVKNDQKGLSGNQDFSTANQLSYDVKKWGDWIIRKAAKEIEGFFHLEKDKVSVAYVWARTVRCKNSSCGAEIPLLQQPWLVKRPKRRVALLLQPDKLRRTVNFVIKEGSNLRASDFAATMKKGTVECPVCKQASKGSYLREEAMAGRMGERLIAVIFKHKAKSGKEYRLADETDLEQFHAAERKLMDVLHDHKGVSLVPNESIPRPPSKGEGEDPFFVHLQIINYGLTNWGLLFNSRQKLGLLTFAKKVKEAYSRMVEQGYDKEYAKAITTYLALALDRLADYDSNVCIWHVGRETMSATIARPAIGMSWSYVELNPLSGSTGDWGGAIDWIVKAIEHCSKTSTVPGQVFHASATKMPFEDEFFDAVITDPPYYDNIPYSDLSDFFYVWLKRSVGFLYPELFSTVLTPKSLEILQNTTLLRRLDAIDSSEKYGSIIKNEVFFESKLTEALNEVRRVLKPDGTLALIFAHKTTTAWEMLISALLKAGFCVSASWPVHTEMMARLQAREHAALASSTWLVCHKGSRLVSVGSWRSVQNELDTRIKERLDYFLSQGIKGADALLSAIGPALEVYGRYSKVEKVSGEPVSVSEFLDKVREVVAHHALTTVLSEQELGKLDSETAFYVLWKWTFEPRIQLQTLEVKEENEEVGAGEDKRPNGNHVLVPFDDALKLARSVRAEIDILLRTRGLLEQEKEYVRLLSPDERKNIHGLGEVSRDGALPTIVDMIHKALNLWATQEHGKLDEYLRASGATTNETFWRVAQALSNLLPLQSREKQLLDGLLARHAGGVSESENKIEGRTLDEFIKKM